MKIAIYSNSSKGGCYEYAKEIAREYANNPECESIEALFPKNAAFVKGSKNILISDCPGKIFPGPLKKIHFILRSIINPVKAFGYARKNDIDLLIFNDFDQLIPGLWVWLYKKRKFKTVVILHDPDRTAYFKYKSLSINTMTKFMSIIDIGFYHEYLPELPYYKNPKIKFEKIPHGIYPVPQADKETSIKINNLKEKGFKVISVVGNIRFEKNYVCIMNALKNIDNAVLIIAGQCVTSKENIQTYKDAARKLGVDNKVIFVNKYLTQNELASYYQDSSLILLYYKNSFKSQSGILNGIISYSTPIIISDINCAMTETAKKYKIAQIVEPDNAQKLSQAINNLEEVNIENRKIFISENSWRKNIEIQINTYKNIIGK